MVPILHTNASVFIPNGKRDQSQFNVDTSGLSSLAHSWEAGAGNYSYSPVVTEVRVETVRTA